MKARLHFVFMCECGLAFYMLDNPLEVKRRRMVCMNNTCPHYDVIYLEPIFEAELFLAP